MNRLALRTEARRFLDDTVAPYEISDDALNFRIDEAIREACARASLIIDTDTASICDIAVTAGTNQYAISPLILDIHRAVLPSAAKPLEKLGYKALDEDDPQWESREATPKAYVLDLNTRKLTLSRIPTATETLTLTVSRLPENDLADDNAEPEFSTAYHYDLVYWVLHLTYLTRDSQIYNPTEAGKYEALFERRFGARKTHDHLERNLRSYRRRGKAQWQ